MNKLLLIVDDWEALEVYAAKLSPHFEILEAPFADEGIRTAQRAKPDRILLDLVFEDVSPEDALAQLAGDPATASIPTVVIGQVPASANVKPLPRPFGYPELIQLLKS